MLSLENVISLAMKMSNSGIGFWDDQNRKIIRNENVTFNEKVVYE